MLKAEELDLNYQPEIVIPDIEALTNEEWLESRMEGIGGSDAGAILGLNKYTTAYQICRSKLGFTGEAERTPEDQYTPGLRTRQREADPGLLRQEDRL